MWEYFLRVQTFEPGTRNEDQTRRAAVDPPVHLRHDVITGRNLPMVMPRIDPIPAQPLGELLDHRAISRPVTQEHLPALRRSLHPVTLTTPST